MCLAGKAGVRPTIDGLVTHSSNAGVCGPILTAWSQTQAKQVCVRHGAEGEKQNVCVRHGAAGEKQVRGNMAVDDTTVHSLPSRWCPVFAAVCLTGEAGVGQHGSQCDHSLPSWGYPVFCLSVFACQCGSTLAAVFRYRVM